MIIANQEIGKFFRRREGRGVDTVFLSLIADLDKFK
jgi:hypothetical protein